MDLPLAAILNALDDAVLCADQNGRVVFLNESAGRLFGCEPWQVMGRLAEMFPTLAAAVRQMRLNEPPLSGGAGKTTRTVQVKPPDGVPSIWDATVSAAVVEDSKLFIAILRAPAGPRGESGDTAHFARKSEAISALAGGIAHDFNNLLTAIISHLDLALTSPEFPESVRPNLLKAQTGARRGAELVGKLQMFSRQTKPKLEPTNALAVIDQALFQLRRSLDPHIQIHYTPPVGPGWIVTADAAHITAAVLNLGLNARDAMPRGGTISIRVERESFPAALARPPRKPGVFLKFSVADTGQGIPSELANRLVEPYSTVKELHRGAGLSLSLTSDVVAEHGGWMEVESRAGHGTEFSFFLPCPGEAPPARRVAVTPEARHVEGRERILIADDEELVRMVTRAVLAYRGYQILEAEDGDDAVKKFQQADPPVDLVLIDMNMPRMNGREALARIRERHPAAKAILFSGGLEEPDGADSRQEGVVFLNKPFDNQELLRLVRELLDLRMAP